MATYERISIYERICGVLKDNGIEYRVINHEPEGNTARGSLLRGHPLHEAAKSMVIEARRKGDVGYYLAVIPGDRRVHHKLLKKTLGVEDVTLASKETTNRLTGCGIGAIPPFSFNPELQLVVDSNLLENDEIVFNAGVLDISFTISANDYLALVAPRLGLFTKADVKELELIR
ncbi:Ala-tRNA(Pro) deacylase [Paenibacillus phyllosphaerae]|uniref:Ala-tRNA(Pro) deacylase n=1 Tax=Paenibacillus phyllosphaerae TaxID=274593 RepID=A0A7W5FQA1_9BACL|nr:YbaK/EbsC family protein [Paenibacillus phyllosphaerae]MBB3113022.1 Ala-tRNA(Pro) deacylase [Paenibacillus phyllosphaerae]